MGGIYVVVSVETRKLSLCRTAADRRKSPSLSTDRALARASRAKTLYQKKNSTLIGHDRRKKRWNGKKSGGRKWGDTSSTYEPDKDKVFTERQRGSVRREKKEEILGEDEEEARV